MWDFFAEPLTYEINADYGAHPQRTSVLCQKTTQMNILFMFRKGFPEEKINQEECAVTLISCAPPTACPLAANSAVGTFHHHTTGSHLFQGSLNVLVQSDEHDEQLLNLLILKQRLVEALLKVIGNRDIVVNGIAGVFDTNYKYSSMPVCNFNL